MAEEISKERLDKLIEDALANQNKLTEEEIYKNIGVSLISMGVEADTDPKKTYFYKPMGNIDLKKSPFNSTNSLVGTLSSAISAEQATAKGKEFWEVFKKKAKEYICGDEGIKKLIQEAKFKEALAAAIPPLLFAMGLGAIWVPVVAVIVVGLIMLLAKAGIDAFCAKQVAVGALDVSASTE